MIKGLIVTGLFLPLFLLVTCKDMPTNPFLDTKNVEISFFLTGNKVSAFAEDSIEVGVIVNIPRLVTSLKSIDGEENNERVLSLKNASSQSADTVIFKTLYKTTGKKTVTIKALFVDSTTRDYPFEIAVIMPPMRVIFDTVPPKDTTVFTAKATVFRVVAHTYPSTPIKYALISSPPMADSCFVVDGTGSTSISVTPPGGGLYGLKIIASNDVVKDTIGIMMFVTNAPAVSVKSLKEVTHIGDVDTLTFTGPENDSLSLDNSGNFTSDEVKVIATGIRNVIKVEFTPKESKTYSFALRVKGVIAEIYRYNDIVFVNQLVAGNQTSIWKQDTLSISTPENNTALKSIESLLKDIKLSDVWLRCEKGTITNGIWQENIPWGARPVDTVVIVATYKNCEYPLKMFIRVSASDGAEPKITLVNPLTADATISSGTIACKFVITDALSGVGGVVFRRGATILSDTLHSGNTYQCIVRGLVKGEKTIVTVEASDCSQKKNMTSLDFALTYDPDIQDNVGPVIKLIHPLVAAFTVPTTEATIQLQCTDQSGIKSVTAKKGTVPLTVQVADSTYTITVSALSAQKTDTVIVTAIDNASTPDTSTLPLFVQYEPSMRDTKGPSIRLVDPVNKDTVDKPSVVMKVVCTDENKIAGVRFMLGGVSGVMNRQDDTTFAMIVPGLVTGKNFITISARDASVNSNVSDSVFTLEYDSTLNDTIKPAITCKQAVHDTLFVNLLPDTLDVVCKDASGIKSVACKKGTSALTVTPRSGNVYSVDIKSLAAVGADTFIFTVTDKATRSNTATKSFFVIYDPIHKYDTAYYKNNFKVTGVNWEVRNSPSDYDTSFRLSYDVNIRYSGVNLAYDQIDTIEVEVGGLTWPQHYDSSSINESSKNLLINDLYCYNPGSRSRLPIDPVRLHVRFKNGEEIWRSLAAAPVPGCQNANGYKFVYTEDCTDAVMSTDQKALARPVVVSAKKGSDTIVVAFTINDTATYNGHIDFYDTANYSLVDTPIFFRDYKSKIITQYINNGTKLFTDGKQINTVRIPISHLKFYSGKTVSNISFIRVNVTDGSQFANISSKTYRESYSYRSFSLKALVQ